MDLLRIKFGMQMRGHHRIGLERFTRLVISAQDVSFADRADFRALATSTSDRLGKGNIFPETVVHVGKTPFPSKSGFCGAFN